MDNMIKDYIKEPYIRVSLEWFTVSTIIACIGLGYGHPVDRQILQFLGTVFMLVAVGTGGVLFFETIIYLYVKIKYDSNEHKNKEQFDVHP